LLFGLLLLGGATFILKCFHDVPYPFAWDDDDGAVWWEIAHVTNLRALYHPIQEYPYFVTPYPPVYHAVTWLAARVTGNIQVAGRLVCIFSALGMSLVFGLLVFQASPRRIPARIRASGAALAALLCFRLDSLSSYMPGIGVDPSAVFLSFLGVWLFVRFAPRAGWTHVAFTIFVLAVFTKETAVAAPMACLIASALIDAKKAIRLLAFYLTLALVILAYLSWQTRGEILRHLFVYNAQQPFSITHLILGMQENLVRMLPLVALACLAFLPFVHHVLFAKRHEFVLWLRAGVRSSPYRRALFVLGLELVTALLISVSYGKVGGGYHYFLEWNLACCPLVGLLMVRAIDSWRPSSRYTLGGAALFLLLFLAALTGFPESLYRLDSVFRLTPGVRRIQDAQYSSAAAALKIVEETPGPVLCQNMVLVMKAHKEIPIEPGIQCFLSKTGVWDQSGFVGMISSQKFGVIIMRTLNNSYWTDEIVAAIKEYYVPSEQIGDETIEDSHYTVYRPKPNLSAR
jgi:hypothetical protein